MDDIIILRKLPHTLSHPLAIPIATQTDQRINSTACGVTQRWSDLLGLTGQIITKKIVLLNREWIYSIMLLIIIVISQNSCLVLSSS